MIQQPSLQPTEVGEGATSLAPEYEALYSLTFPDNPLGVAEPPVVPLLPEGSVRILGLVPENLETPPPTFSGRRKRPEPLQPCDILEEAVTMSRILQEPGLTDILQRPVSAFSPPTSVPQVKPEPEEVVEIPDSPPRKCTSPVGAPIDYKKAYEDLQQRFRGHMTQLHFWAEIVGGLGTEGSRLPTPRSRPGADSSLVWATGRPGWKTPLLCLCQRWERGSACTMGRSSMRGGPILSKFCKTGGNPGSGCGL